ncbi:MAG: hypothetical protein ACXAD7_08010 [Candidatus Kariarchaeaceae archaeon]
MIVLIITPYVITGDNVPTPISRSTQISEGSYLLLADDDINNGDAITLSYSEDGKSDLSISISYTIDVIASFSFSSSFKGSEKITEHELLIGTIPVTINSSGIDNWQITTAYDKTLIESDTAKFYYITENEFKELNTSYAGPSAKELVFLKEYVGNGTYTLLGKPRNQALIRLGFIMIAVFYVVITILLITSLVIFINRKKTPDH